MKIKEISLQIAQTVNMHGDYVKTGATITVTLDEKENVDTVTKKALKQLEYNHELVIIQAMKGIEDVIDGNRGEKEDVINRLEKKHAKRTKVSRRKNDAGRDRVRKG